MTQASTSTQDAPGTDAGVSVGESIATGSNAFDYDYRPVPTLVPIAVCCGLVSLTSFVFLSAITIGVVGQILSLMALRRIRRSEGTLSGTPFALVALALCIVVPIAGVGYQMYEYHDELPDGYHRVNFPREISAKQFVIKEGQRELHQDVKPLDGQAIFIKGYMYQTKEAKGLRRFVLLKDNGECCFGGDPKPYDMIGVRMQGTKKVDSVEGMVAVGGVLRANPAAKPGTPVYILEGSYFSKARTAF
ncbi:MAG: DUF4190 domain-containing protein [Planctomycetaceae bacterium]